MQMQLRHNSRGEANNAKFAITKCKKQVRQSKAMPSEYKTDAGLYTFFFIQLTFSDI